jgi:peptidyl-prolyl cis-trans isomerase A (cyclophilin A)/peptidyl-prolyl cis-trans isomerase B (cyclophilin B)
MKPIRILLIALALLAAAPAFAANPHVVLQTNMGRITLELYPDNAPKTVENFLAYVREGHYDGTTFHRVIPGFMIQGGGFTPEWKEKPTHPAIRNEAPTGLGNSEGMVAMARTADPHSATAQFFINLVPNRFLDFKSPTKEGYGYCVFARVSDGMDVVRRIAQVPTHQGPPPHENVPVKPVVIQRAEVVDGAPTTAK